MAAKIIPMKHNPVSLHSSSMFNSAEDQYNFKALVAKHYDTKAPKDNEFVMKSEVFYGLHTRYEGTGTKDYP